MIVEVEAKMGERSTLNSDLATEFLERPIGLFLPLLIREEVRVAVGVMLNEQVCDGPGIRDGQGFQEIPEAAQLVEAEAAFPVEGR